MIHQGPKGEPWAAGGALKVLLDRPLARSMQEGRAAEIERATGAELRPSDRAPGWNGGDMNELYVRGETGPVLKEALRVVIEEVEQSFGPRGTNTIRLKLVVPRWLASVIIGYRGMNVKELCKSTGTLVHIDKDVSSDGDGMEQVANVQGPPSNILDVLGRILQFQQDRNEARLDGPGNAQSAEEAHSERPASLEPRDSEPDASGRPAAPPPPWKLEEHPEAPGEWYYLNTETGATTWELPEDFERAAHASADEDGADYEPLGRPASPPPPWRTVEHPEAPGEWYYLNEDTGETCWELPEEADRPSDTS